MGHATSGVVIMVEEADDPTEANTTGTCQHVIRPDELIKLWDQHGASLELLARARCASPEDCVQLAFIRLAKRSVCPDDPVAWLARVVRNAAIDQSRTETRRKEREQAFAASVSEAFDSQGLLSAEYTPQEVALALKSLDVDARELVTAHVWGGLSFRQIAAAFEISSSVAHRRYTAAIEQLRTTLVSAERLSTE